MQTSLPKLQLSKLRVNLKDNVNPTQLEHYASSSSEEEQLIKQSHSFQVSQRYRPKLCASPDAHHFVFDEQKLQKITDYSSNDSNYILPTDLNYFESQILNLKTDLQDQMNNKQAKLNEIFQELNFASMDHQSLIRKTFAEFDRIDYNCLKALEISQIILKKYNKLFYEKQDIEQDLNNLRSQNQSLLDYSTTEAQQQIESNREILLNALRQELENKEDELQEKIFTIQQLTDQVQGLQTKLWDQVQELSNKSLLQETDRIMNNEADNEQQYLGSDQIDRNPFNRQQDNVQVDDMSDPSYARLNSDYQALSADYNKINKQNKQYEERCQMLQNLNNKCIADLNSHLEKIKSLEDSNERLSKDNEQLQMSIALFEQKYQHILNQNIQLEHQHKSELYILEKQIQAIRQYYESNNAASQNYQTHRSIVQQNLAQENVFTHEPITARDSNPIQSLKSSLVGQRQNPYQFNNLFVEELEVKGHQDAEVTDEHQAIAHSEMKLNDQQMMTDRIAPEDQKTQKGRPTSKQIDKATPRKDELSFYNRGKAKNAYVTQQLSKPFRSQNTSFNINDLDIAVQSIPSKQNSPPGLESPPQMNLQQSINQIPNNLTDGSLQKSCQSTYDVLNNEINQWEAKETKQNNNQKQSIQQRSAPISQEEITDFNSTNIQQQQPAAPYNISGEMKDQQQNMIQQSLAVASLISQMSSDEQMNITDTESLTEYIQLKAQNFNQLLNNIENKLNLLIKQNFQYQNAKKYSPSNPDNQRQDNNDINKAIANEIIPEIHVLSLMLSNILLKIAELAVRIEIESKEQYLKEQNDNQEKEKQVHVLNQRNEYYKNREEQLVEELVQERKKIKVIEEQKLNSLVDKKDMQEQIHELMMQNSQLTATIQIYDDKQNDYLQEIRNQPIIEKKHKGEGAQKKDNEVDKLTNQLDEMKDQVQDLQKHKIWQQEQAEADQFKYMKQNAIIQQFQQSNMWMDQHLSNHDEELFRLQNKCDNYKRENNQIKRQLVNQFEMKASHNKQESVSGNQFQSFVVDVEQQSIDSDDLNNQPDYQQQYNNSYDAQSQQQYLQDHNLNECANSVVFSSTDKNQEFGEYITNSNRASQHQLQNTNQLQSATQIPKLNLQAIVQNDQQIEQRNSTSRMQNNYNSNMNHYVDIMDHMIRKSSSMIISSEDESNNQRAPMLGGSLTTEVNNRDVINQDREQKAECQQQELESAQTPQKTFDQLLQLKENQQLTILDQYTPNFIENDSSKQIEQTQSNIQFTDKAQTATEDIQDKSLKCELNGGNQVLQSDRKEMQSNMDNISPPISPSKLIIVDTESYIESPASPDDALQGPFQAILKHPEVNENNGDESTILQRADLYNQTNWPEQEIVSCQSSSEVSYQNDREAANGVDKQCQEANEAVNDSNLDEQSIEQAQDNEAMQLSLIDKEIIDQTYQQQQLRNATNSQIKKTMKLLQSMIDQSKDQIQSNKENDGAEANLLHNEAGIKLEQAIEENPGQEEHPVNAGDDPKEQLASEDSQSNAAQQIQKQFQDQDLLLESFHPQNQSKELVNGHDKQLNQTQEILNSIQRQIEQKTRIKHGKNWKQQ